MKSGKYRYFAGGLIRGKSGELLKILMGAPATKKSIKIMNDFTKQKYSKESILRGKQPPAGLMKLDLQRNKANLLQDTSKRWVERFVKEAKGKVKIFGKTAPKGTIERIAVARAAKAHRNLNLYKKSLDEKGAAILERYFKKKKNN